MYQPDTAPVAQPKQSWQVLNGPRRAAKRSVPRSWVLGVVGLVVTVLVLYVHTVNQEFQLSQEQKAIAQMKQDTQRLRLHLASLQNPNQVEKLAVQNLAMKQPAEVVYMTPPAPAAAAPTNRIPLPPAVIHEGF